MVASYERLACRAEAERSAGLRLDATIEIDAAKSDRTSLRRGHRVPDLVDRSFDIELDDPFDAARPVVGDGDGVAIALVPLRVVLSGYDQIARRRRCVPRGPRVDRRRRWRLAPAVVARQRGRAVGIPAPQTEVRSLGESENEIAQPGARPVERLRDLVDQTGQVLFLLQAARITKPLQRDTTLN